MHLSYNYYIPILHSIFICIISIYFPINNAHAAKIEPGFRTESLWLPKKQIKIDLAIWYPTLKKPLPVNYGDWYLFVAQNAKPLPGKYPVIILSHDSVASRFYHHHIATILTQKGFVVIAPTHQGDNADDMEHIFTLQQIKNRIYQINTIIDFLFKEKELSQIINTQQIGFLGIGIGGTVGLLLAGAKLDPAGWPDYCHKTISTNSKNQPTLDIYCSSWTKKRIDTLVQNLDPQESYLNPRLSAIISVAPNFGMLFSKSSLASLKKPLLIVEIENDHINIPQYHSRNIVQQLSTPYELFVLKDTSPLLLIAPCSEALEQILPEICPKHLDKQKTYVCQQFTDKVALFFLTNFKKNKKRP